MEAKIEIKDGVQIITCGEFKIENDTLFWLYKSVENSDKDLWVRLWSEDGEQNKMFKDLDALYAVLHARHVAQQYDKSIMSRIGKAVNHE